MLHTQQRVKKGMSRIGQKSKLMLRTIAVAKTKNCSHTCQNILFKKSHSSNKEALTVLDHAETLKHTQAVAAHNRRGMMTKGCAHWALQSKSSKSSRLPLLLMLRATLSTADNANNPKTMVRNDPPPINGTPKDGMSVIPPPP